jgi:K+-transporting ATPase ATPase A chain
VISMYMFPVAVLGIGIIASIPVGRYMAAVFDGKLWLPRWLQWIEQRIDTGPQNWRQYIAAMFIFTAAKTIVGFTVIALQTHHPGFLNPDERGELALSTLFHTTLSMVTNSEQQHYSGEVHLSYGSQLFLVLWTFFVSPAPGLAALAAMIRGLRGDPHLGNFYIDVWRSIVCVFLPLSLVFGVLMMAAGVPMTMEGAARVATVDGVEQIICRGPVAAIEAIKQLATAGGGYFGANSCHPFETPDAWAALLGMLLIVLLPFAQVVMFGRMIGQPRHAAVLFAVMLTVMLVSIGWCVYFDAACPNPALTAHEATTYQIPDPTAPSGQRVLAVPAVVALPVDQSEWGNLEGKELRFGPGAGPAWAAMTTTTANGSNACMHDSLNPLAGLALLIGIWLNCNFGAVGSGLLTIFIYVVLAVFFAGLMIGRSPEYLGRKLEAREMKLAMLALLWHPLLSLGGTGLFLATGWGMASTNNPGAHGFSEIVYEFSSASANNGSGLEGLGDTNGFRDANANPSPPAPYSVHWDIACGLVVVLGRYGPIVLLLILAGGMASKPAHPAGVGTLRTDTITFGVMLFGTILLAGVLLFLPAAALGPLAEHYGPIPFGR